MDRDEIKSVVKSLIAKVTSLDPDEIADNASFRDDLELDSLAMIEIGVEVDYAYKLHLSEEEMASLQTVEEAVGMVVKKLAEKDLVAAEQ